MSGGVLYQKHYCFHDFCCFSHLFYVNPWSSEPSLFLSSLLSLHFFSFLFLPYLSALSHRILSSMPLAIADWWELSDFSSSLTTAPNSASKLLRWLCHLSKEPSTSMSTRRSTANSLKPRGKFLIAWAHQDDGQSCQWVSVLVDLYWIVCSQFNMVSNRANNSCSYQSVLW